MKAPIKKPMPIKLKLHPTVQELDWDKIIAYAGSHIKDKLEKRGVLDAIDILKSKIGDDFIGKAKRAAPDFLWKFIFITFWNKFEVISLANQISALEHEKNFDKIIFRLKSRRSDKFNEALTLLDTAYLFKKGFQINFAPVVPETLEFHKCPDLGIKNGSLTEEILIEVAELQDSEEKGQIEKVMKVAFPHFFISLGIKSFGRLSKLISIIEAEKIRIRINAEISSDLSKGFWLIKEEDYFDYVAYTPSPINETKANDVANELGLNLNGFQGPVFEKSELVRLKHKMQHELIQLPPNRTNLLVIWADTAMIDARYSESILGDIADAFLKEYSHLSGIFLMGKYPNDSFIMPGNAEINILKSKDNMIYYFYCKFNDEMTEVGTSIVESIGYERIA